MRRPTRCRRERTSTRSSQRFGRDSFGTRSMTSTQGPTPRFSVPLWYNHRRAACVKPRAAILRNHPRSVRRLRRIRFQRGAAAVERRTRAVSPIFAPQPLAAHAKRCTAHHPGAVIAQIRRMARFSDDELAAFARILVSWPEQLRLLACGSAVCRSSRESVSFRERDEHAAQRSSSTGGGKLRRLLPR